MEHYDVAVIGAGPSGSSAAKMLADAGLKVCIIDKQSFPRQKLCGGGLTLRSRALFESIFGADIETVSLCKRSGMSFFDNGRFLCEEPGYSMLYFTDRALFDHALLQSAEASGAKALLGSGLASLDAAAKTLTLTDGTQIGYRFLIGADGVNSLVARTLFGKSFDQKTIGFALEVEVPADRVPDQRQTPEIHFRAANWGYGWVFPKGDHFTIGIGGLLAENETLRDDFRVFLQKRIGPSDDLKIKGHHLPFGTVRIDPAVGRILLCGDAAGLVDSVTGEGIAFAMESGAMAGHTIIEAVRGQDDARVGDLYRPQIATIAKEIEASNFYRRFLFPRPFGALFVRVIADAGTLQRGYLDILAGKIGYSAMPQLMRQQLVRALRKGLIALGRPIFGR